MPYRQRPLLLRQFLNQPYSYDRPLPRLMSRRLQTWSLEPQQNPDPSPHRHQLLDPPLKPRRL